MLRVKEAPVGYWEWWFGRECGTIKRRDGEARVLLSLHLTCPGTCSASSEKKERKVPFVVPNTNLHLDSEQWFPICLVRTKNDEASKCWWNLGGVWIFQTFKKRLGRITSPWKDGERASKCENIKVHSEESSYQFLIHWGIGSITVLLNFGTSLWSKQ